MEGLAGLVVAVVVIGVVLDALAVFPLAFLGGLFLLGTAGFWILILLESVILVSLLEYEEEKRTGMWATVSLVVTLLLLQQFGDVKVLTNVWNHPANSALWVLGYFAAGTLWSLAKWWFYLRNKREKYDEAKRSFLKEKRVSGDAVPENLKKEWTAKWRCVYKYKYRNYPPDVSEHKSLILMWMTYWPWSAFWTLLNDPIKRVFNQIFLHLRGVYEGMRDRVFRGVENDLLPSGTEEDE